MSAFSTDDLKRLRDDLVSLNSRILGPAITPSDEWETLADDTLVSIMDRLGRACSTAHSDSIAAWHEEFESAFRRLESVFKRKLAPAIDQGSPAREVVESLGLAISDVLKPMHALLDDPKFGVVPARQVGFKP